MSLLLFFRMESLKLDKRTDVALNKFDKPYELQESNLAHKVLCEADSQGLEGLAVASSTRNNGSCIRHKFEEFRNS